MLNKFLVAVVIIIIIAFIGFLISSVEVPELEEEGADEVISLAEDWIVDAPTFKERGGTDLEHLRTVEIGENTYEATFTFNSSFAGYGVVREEEMAAQVITPHTVVVTVEEGEIISVIIDEVFDEINQEEKEIIDDNVLETTVYFVKFENNVEEFVPVKREVSGNEDIEEKTLLLLLEGLTEEEKNSGYSTAINEEVKIKSFNIEDKTAYVDFSEELEVSGGSALVMMIREQIERTLLQFETIENVVISIEGETEEILQP